MAWIRLDDQIAHHPKFVQAGPVAAWLWVCGLSYCARYLTDGFIPRDALSTLGPIRQPEKAAATLVAVRLWDDAENGWRIHDYHDFQPTREDVEQRREIRRQSGRLGGRRKAELAKAQQHAKQHSGSLLGVRQADATYADLANGVANVCPVPDPVPVESATENVALSPRGRASLSERRSPRIQNHGDPVPLWDWQFSKFRDALRPQFGEKAWTETMSWVHRVGDELQAAGKPVDVSDPVKWWDARYAADWGSGAADPLAAFIQGRTA